MINKNQVDNAPNESIDSNNFYEGGKPSKYDSAKKGKESSAAKGKEEPELTEEEKKAKEAKNALCQARAKELLWSYVKSHQCMMIFGLGLNVLGMVGEFASPYFIGQVIDAITLEDWDMVTTLTIYWMIFNTVSILFISYAFRSVPSLQDFRDTSSSSPQNQLDSNWDRMSSSKSSTKM